MKKITVTLDQMMAKRKIRLNELATRIGITEANLSILKTDKAKAIRFSTLEALCKALDCQPGDLLTWNKNHTLIIIVCFFTTLTSTIIKSYYKKTDIAITTR